jgi:hypothetical protein
MSTHHVPGAFRFELPNLPDTLSPLALSWPLYSDQYTSSAALSKWDSEHGPLRQHVDRAWSITHRTPGQIQPLITCANCYTRKRRRWLQVFDRKLICYTCVFQLIGVAHARSSRITNKQNHHARSRIVPYLQNPGQRGKAAKRQVIQEYSKRLTQPHSSVLEDVPTPCPASNPKQDQSAKSQELEALKKSLETSLLSVSEWKEDIFGPKDTAQALAQHVASRKFIVEICNNIHARVEPHVTKENSPHIVDSIPDLIELFARELWFVPLDGINWSTISFVQKHHQYVSSTFVYRPWY